MRGWPRGAAAAAELVDLVRAWCGDVVAVAAAPAGCPPRALPGGEPVAWALLTARGSTVLVAHEGSRPQVRLRCRSCRLVAGPGPGGGPRLGGRRAGRSPPRPPTRRRPPSRRPWPGDGRAGRRAATPTGSGPTARSAPGPPTCRPAPRRRRARRPARLRPVPAWIELAGGGRAAAPAPPRRCPGTRRRCARAARPLEPGRRPSMAEAAAPVGSG